MLLCRGFFDVDLKIHILIGAFPPYTHIYFQLCRFAALTVLSAMRSAECTILLLVMGNRGYVKARVCSKRRLARLVRLSTRVREVRRTSTLTFRDA